MFFFQRNISVLVMKIVVKQERNDRLVSDVLNGKTIDRATTLNILDRAERRELRPTLNFQNPEMMICAELIDSGHLDGCVTLDNNGIPKKVSEACITASGKEFLGQFQTETVNPFVLMETRRLIRSFGFAALFIGLLFAFPKTNQSREKVAPMHAESFSKPANSKEDKTSKAH